MLFSDHTCPWWLAYSWDHRLRGLFHDPSEILKPHMRPGDVVADIGCGMGYFSIAMADFVGPDGKVFAVDVQQKMLDVLLKRSSRCKNSRVIFPILSAEDIPEIPEALNFILNFWVLHEVKEKERFLKGCLTRLKTEGKYLLVEPKIHITQKRFEKEISVCRQAGFKMIDRPKIALSRSALFGRL